MDNGPTMNRIYDPVNTIYGTVCSFHHTRETNYFVICWINR